MYVKEKGTSVCVLLIYSITVTTALSSVVWSGQAPLTHRNVSDRLLNAAGTGRKRPLSAAEDRQPQHRSGPVTADQLPPGHQSRTAASARSLAARTTSSDPADLHKERPSQEKPGPERRFPRLQLSTLDCGKGKITVTTPGKFYIVGKLEPNIPDSDVQSDSASSVQAEGQLKTTGEWLSSSEESWHRLQPVVECGGESMVLHVRRRRAGHLLLDRVNASSVLLTQLSPDCGYSVQTTSRDLSLEAQYDACHVTQEADSYVLPLLWRGATVKMSCPVSQLQPAVTGLFSVCCSAHGLMVQLQGLSPAEEMKINVRGEWIPLVFLAEQCGYTVDRRHADTVIFAPYLTCGMSVKDDKHTLYLQLEENTLTLSCPLSPPPQEPSSTPQPHVDKPQLLDRKSKTHESFQWATPFYLAPLHYPHPTYQHISSLRPSVDAEDLPPTPPPPTPPPPTPPPPAPEPPPVVDPQTDFTEYFSRQIPIREYKEHKGRHPPGDPEDSGLVGPDPEPKRGGSVSGPSQMYGSTDPVSPAAVLPDQVEAPSLQPPGHAFSPYYHYYHHPKIPLSGLQHPDPRPEVPEKLISINPHNPFNIPAVPLNVQQWETDPDQVSESGTVSKVGREEPAAHGHSVPHLHHYFYYIPYILKGEAQTSAEGQDVETKLSRLHRHSPSADLQNEDKNTLNPFTEPSNSDGIKNGEKYKSGQKKTSLLPDAGGSNSGSGDKQRPVSPDHVSVDSSPHPGLLPPQLLFYFPSEQHHHQAGYGPTQVDEEAADALLQAKQHPPNHEPQHFDSSAESEPTYETQTGLQLPNYHHYYHYYPLFEPQAATDEQETESFKSKIRLPADSGPSSVDAKGHSDAPAFPSIPEPQHSAPYGLYLPYSEPWQHLKDPDGEGGGEERPDEELRDCTPEQYFMFVLPYPVEPTLTLQSPEGGDVLFGLQPLTSDLGNFVQLLDVHALNEQVFEPAAVHLLEVPMICSPQKDQSPLEDVSPDSRPMMGCSSSQDSSVEASLSVKDEPPPPPTQTTPAAMAVKMRIGTDESFSSFYPEAPLPLSHIQGRPLHLEVSLLDPPDPDLVLLVHSCLAFAQAPYPVWMPIYDICSSWSDSHQLPSTNHIRRIIISNFLFPTPESPFHTSKGGHSPPSDTEGPQIYFSCSTNVCSAADTGCTVGCNDSMPAPL